MKVILVAGSLLALAGLALGASLMPAGRVNQVYVSVGGPGVPAVLAPAAAPKAPTSNGPVAKSIAGAAGQQVEAVAPVIAAPPPVRRISPSAPPNPTPQVQQPQVRCHGEKKLCPPRPD